jgi:HD-GYP domain-containing protein (c-di-GMP phosphodiesterase class II)
VNDVRTHPIIADWRGRAQQAGLESLILFPLGLESKPIGVLCIFAGKSNAFADPAEVALLTEMVGDLSFGIHTLRVREENQRNQMLLAESKRELEAAYDATLEGWANALELRERETAGHSRRVIDLTIRLAKALVLPEESVDHIRRGALLHDIGKMGIPDSILLKPGPLSPDEWVVMRQHPLYAEHLLSTIHYLTQAIEIPMYHHERWDGSGYPAQLKGQYIPLAARIFAVVDVWDALTSDRPYRKAWSPQAARTYLAEQAGILFDPFIIEIFLKNL